MNEDGPQGEDRRSTIQDRLSLSIPVVNRDEGLDDLLVTRDSEHASGDDEPPRWLMTPPLPCRRLPRRGGC